VAVLAGVVALSFLFAPFMAGSISRPITGAVARLEQLARGDLESPVPASASMKEPQILLSALETTVISLKLCIENSGLLKSIAQGDLNVHPRQDYQGDFAPIHQSLETIIRSLSSVFREIGEAALAVKQSSEQVSSGSAQYQTALRGKRQPLSS
jgi:methyl-accepting chemotaxis protein